MFAFKNSSYVYTHLKKQQAKSLYLGSFLYVISEAFEQEPRAAVHGKPLAAGTPEGWWPAAPGQHSSGRRGAAS